MILKHFDEKVIQSAYEPYNGFNFHYLFLTSVCLICVSHVVNIVYWAVRRVVDPTVFVSMISVTFNCSVFPQILQPKESCSKAKMLLFSILPYVPSSLPTLLFCRITELTINLEGDNVMTYTDWEEMVQERSQLMDVSSDIKMIGETLRFPRLFCLSNQFPPQKLCVRRLASLWFRASFSSVSNGSSQKMTFQTLASAFRCTLLPL